MNFDQEYNKRRNELLFGSNDPAVIKDHLDAGRIHPGAIPTALHELDLESGTQNVSEALVHLILPVMGLRS